MRFFHHPEFGASRLAVMNHQTRWEWAPADKRFFLTWTGTGPAVSGATITFDIVRKDDVPAGQEIAPAAFWLRATNIVGAEDYATGNAISEPATDTNLYDETQSQLTFVWTLPDESYTPVQTPNIPDVWRSFTFDYGKQIAVVFTTPGTKTVRCFAFDQRGNWGEATHVFGPGGDSAVIQDPEVYFLNKTIYVSNGSANGGTPDFSAVPGGVSASDQVSTTGDIINRMRQLYDAGAAIVRVLFLRGEEWVDLADSTLVVGRDNKAVHWDAFGTGARPIFRQISNNVPFAFSDNDVGASRLSNVDLVGPWDAARETGRWAFGNSGTGSGEIMYKNSGMLLFHRVKWSGFHNIALGFGGFDAHRVLFDCEVTNFANFGFLNPPTKVSFVWCDLHQHEDAPNGLNGSDNGNSNETQMGNLHGPFRGCPHWFHVSRSSMFSRCGWSQGNPQDFLTSPPTSPQAALRMEDSVTPAVTPHINITMSSFEGGENVLLHAWFSGTPGAENCARNFVYDKIISCAVAGTVRFFNSNYQGHTVRNSYFVRPNAVSSFTSTTRAPMADGASVIGLDGYSALPTNIAPDRFYNNTIVLLGPSSNLASTVDADPQPILLASQVATRGTLTNANNIFYAPDLTTPIGAGFGPMTEVALTGFAPRYKGDRWGFPIIGCSYGQALINETSLGVIATYTATDGSGVTIDRFARGIGDARELETSVNEDVPDWGGDPAAGWIKIPYPDYSGYCVGALDSLLASTAGGVFPANIRSLILSNSTQKHQLSIRNIETKRMMDSSMWSDADGLIAIDFATDGIRIQNRSGVTWPALENITQSVSGVNRPFTVQTRLFFKPDLSDYFMDFKAGTASPAVPLLVPATGSAGIVGSRTNPWAHDSFLLTVREGSIDSATGNAVTGGVHRQGAAA